MLVYALQFRILSDSIASLIAEYLLNRVSFVLFFQRHMESLEEGVLQQQRQRFEEMQAYLKAQHAAQMAALTEGREKAQSELDKESGAGECVFASK